MASTALAETSEERAARLLEAEARQFNSPDVEMVGFADIEGTMTIIYDRYSHDWTDSTGLGKCRERRVSTFRPDDSCAYGAIIETEHGHA